MGILSWFSGGSKAVDNVLDKDNGLIAQAGSFIGNLNLTDEEVMENNSAIAKGVREFAVDTLEENTERSKTRRDIAELWIKAQLGLVFLCAIAAPFDMDLATFYFTLASCGLMTGMSISIGIFFFGSHSLEKHNKSKK